MEPIEGLRKQYDQMGTVLKPIQSILSNRNKHANPEDTLKEVVKYRNEFGMIENQDLHIITCLIDAIGIADNYITCINAINELEKVMKESVMSRTGKLDDTKKKVITTQNRLDASKKRVEKSYCTKLDSIDALIQFVWSSAEDAIEQVQEKMRRMVEEGKELMKRNGTIDVSASVDFPPAQNLPDMFLIGQSRLKTTPPPFYAEIGCTGQDITINLKTNGNIWIDPVNQNMDTPEIDNFITAYILRFLEKFPIGTVNVHLFDKNPKSFYLRMRDIFESANATDIAKRTITIHESLNDLENIRKRCNNDLIKKINQNNKSDLYELHENDSAEPFQLIIIRKGLLESNGYASAEILDTLQSLSNPGEPGHRCGLRFVIVGSIAISESSIAENVKQQLNAIRSHCEQITLPNNEKDYLHISGNTEAFVGKRSEFIFEKINQAAKNSIPLNDIIDWKETPSMGSIIRIPVGKSGGKIVELSISCKNVEKTLEGNNIGFMVIGKSGFGKSNFLNAFVLSGCAKYSPVDLQFWLLDFKFGGTVQSYIHSDLPHIRIISENNKVDDALCLFRMILDEMEMRTAEFKRNGFDNIIDYNDYAKQFGKDSFSRIVIVIDEVQEIFRDDNASELNNLISQISGRMRSNGIHIVMIAQNMSDGKITLLKDSFLKTVSGRICFNLAQDSIRESSFGKVFTDRQEEIANLRTGEIFVSYDSGASNISKVSLVNVEHDEMKTLFSKIKDKYPQKPSLHLIGSKERLSLLSEQQGSTKNYSDSVLSLKPNSERCSIVLGEDVYRMIPKTMDFSQNQNASVVFVGNDALMASSLCTSSALSLMRQNTTLHLLNADNTSGEHPFQYICKNCGNMEPVHIHRPAELKNVLAEFFSEFQTRKTMAENSVDRVSFEPVFLIINDLFEIGDFESNVTIELNAKTNVPQSENTGSRISFGISKSSGSTSDSAQSIMSKLITNGYKYNIHLILSIRGDYTKWRGFRFSDAGRIIVFNQATSIDGIGSKYYLNEMLKNIANENEEETVAVWYSNQMFSKIRPILYRISDTKEKEAIDRLIKGGLL